MSSCMTPQGTQYKTTCTLKLDINGVHQAGKWLKNGVDSGNCTNMTVMANCKGNSDKQRTHYIGYCCFQYTT